MTVTPLRPYSSDLVPCDYSASWIEDAAILTLMRWLRQNWGGGGTMLNFHTEHDFYNSRNGRSPGKVADTRKGLLRGCWWPVGPKLVSTRRQCQFQKLWTAVCSITKYIVFLNVLTQRKYVNSKFNNCERTLCIMFRISVWHYVITGY
jgi:hypothetical protein